MGSKIIQKQLIEVSRKEGKKMSKLTEVLKITPAYNQKEGTVTLTFKEFDRISEFIDLKDFEIESRDEKIRRQKLLYNLLGKRKDELYNCVLSSCREKIENFLSREDNREKIKKEKEDLFLNFSEKMSPYYEQHKCSDTIDSDCCGHAFEECPTIWALLHTPEARLLNPCDIGAIYEEFSLFTKEEQFKLDHMVIKFIDEKTGSKLHEDD